jgi:hypothetical protein
MHPLASDLTQLTNEELSAKVGELNKRLQFANRMGHTGMISQIQLLLENYMVEQQNRHQKMMDDLQKNNKNFTDKIDIAK